MRGAHADGAAVAAVEALGALADDQEVDRSAVGDVVAEGGDDAGVELRGAEVDVVVEQEAQAEEEAALEKAAGNRGRAGGRAHRTEDDRVGLLELVDDRIGEDLAGAQPALGAQVVVDELEGVLADGGVEHLEALGHDLGADPVTRDDGDGQLLLCGSHRGSLVSGGLALGGVLTAGPGWWGLGAVEGGATWACS